MKEIETLPGDHIGKACERLVAAAPAFMVFNDVRVEANAGDTAGDCYARWDAEMNRKRAEYEASDLYKQRQAEAERRAAQEKLVQDEVRAKVAASGLRDKHPWTETMGEISGFGGGYEAACRDMVYAGMLWLSEHPNADLSKESDDVSALDDALLAAEPGCSGAMHGAAMSHVAFIAKNGWDEYVKQLSGRAAKPVPLAGNSGGSDG